MQAAGNCIEKSIPMTTNLHTGHFGYSTTQIFLVLDETWAKFTVE